MFTTILSFLGSAGLRMLWGEVASWITKFQDHKQELALLQENRISDKQTHEQNLERMKVANQLGLQTIELNGNIARDLQEGSTFAEAAKQLGLLTNYPFIDKWKSSIVPMAATLCLSMIVLDFIKGGLVMKDYHKELAGSVLGLFVADRFLFRRSK